MKKSDPEYKKTQSRKWRLVLLVLTIITIGTFAPPLLSAWVFGAASPLMIVSGAEFVSVVTLIVSAYFGANVLQKHVENKASASIELKANVEATEVESNEEGEA